ncbi:MAG: amino acid adenylation domain-containing protein, partial [bacterium]|nr:amino acid adenylation domain-containing protein [bacterium]
KPDIPVWEIDMIAPEEKIAGLGNVPRCYPLSHSQKRIYYIEKTYPNTACNNLAFSVRYPQIPDKGLLARAIHGVILANDGLRLRILSLDAPVERGPVTPGASATPGETGMSHATQGGDAITCGGEPHQYIAPCETFTLEEIDFSGIQNDREIRERLERKTSEPLPLYNANLYYFAYQGFDGKEPHVTGAGYYMKLHRIVADDWAAQLIIEEIDRAYHRLKSAVDAPDEIHDQNESAEVKNRGKSGLPARLHHMERDSHHMEAHHHLEKRPSYLRYLRDEKEYIYSKAAEEDRKFWHQNLIPLPDAAPLSLTGSNSLDIEGGVELLSLPDSLRDLMHNFCREHKFSLFKIIFAALSIYISRVTGTGDIVIGTVSHNRSTSLHKKTTGMLGNSVPLRTRVEEEDSFFQFMKNAAKHINQVIDNFQKYPFDLLLDQIRAVTHQDPGFLLDVNLFDHGNIPEPGFKVDQYFSGYESTPLSIHIDGSKRGIAGVPDVRWNYRKARFSPQEIRSIHRGLTAVLTDALDNPAGKIGEIDILSRDEKQFLLEDFNNTQVQYPAEKTLHRLFAEQVERTPHRIAVIGASLRGRTGAPLFHADSRIQATYKEVNDRASHLALRLMRQGVGADQIVGIMVERSLEMIIALLAVLKAGGAYLPIDPVYPEGRIAYMLADSGTQILLTTATGASKITFDKEIITIETQAESPVQSHHDEPDTTVPSNLAYVIYTSGTTGKPKGVLVEHANVVAYIHAFSHRFKVSETDIVLQQASYAFDAFVEEMYPVLTAGGKLIVSVKNEVLDSGIFARGIVRSSATLISCSPLMLNQLSRLPLAGSCLRIIISGGDVLNRRHIGRFFFLETATVYNTYGPTEGTVCATYHECRPEESGDISIGRPIANYRVYILNKTGRLLPPGVPGELCIGGAGVARGYLNRPQLTAEKFRTLHPGMHQPHVLYSTGDQVRLMPDGNIAFMGRLDNQINIRGYRVETGEIQHYLSSHPQIGEAVVIDKQDDEGDIFLCAYFTAASDLQTIELREYLAAQLPEHMIPSYFIQLDKIPLASTGKVDKKALPEP